MKQLGDISGMTVLGVALFVIVGAIEKQADMQAIATGKTLCATPLVVTFC